MSADLHPFPLGSPGGRVLCNECASHLFVIFNHADRWTICRNCDAGWFRVPAIDANVRVGPPVMMQSEERR